MPWVAQAKLLLLDSKPKAAEEAARRAVDEGEDFDRSYTMLGEALLAQGRRKEGFEMLRKAVEMEQGFLRARLVYAYRLQDANQLEEAVVELKKVIEFDPDHPTANLNLGVVYVASSRFAEALPPLKKAFAATHDFRAAHNLGLVYLNLKYFPEAIRAFSDAYLLEPYPTTARNLAECYELVGRKADARHWYEVAVQGFDRELARGATRSAMLFGRSFCVAKLGRFDEALSNIQEGMTLEPKQSVYLFRAAQIHALAGHREAAYNFTRRAIQEGYPREEFRSDPAFRSFQDDPEFRTILESAPSPRD
jgi:tetratricopeptide (TPR) repeat protein